MSLLGATAPTLIDIAKSLDPDGTTADVAELLSQNNEVLTDMGWMEGNLPTGHRTTVRTGLPTVAWRLLNQGVSGSKGSTAQVDEQCGMLEAWAEVDKDLAELNGNTASYRLQQAKAFIQAMNQEMVGTLFYGNSGTAPEEYTGLSIRYSSLSAANAQNIIDAGGIGSDNSSIWLIVWGTSTLSGIFPKGSKAGLTHENLGLVTVDTAATAGIGTARMRAYQDHWQWKCGLAVMDWRYAVRVCNIDISNLVAQTGQADLITALIKATYRIPDFTMGRASFYMNRSCAQYLDIQRRNDAAGGGITLDTVDGKRVMSFRGIPIRICDQLTEAEARVT